MAMKKYNPITPSLRFTTVVDRSDLSKKEPEKSLTAGKLRTGGRNSNGQISSRFIGGGAKQSYRIIDFKRDKPGVAAKVASIEYDPNRSARIALLNYVDGEKRYIIAPVGLEVGRTVSSGHAAQEHPGRYGGAQYRTAARQRRTDGPLGGHSSSVDFEGGRHCAPQVAVR
jgi:large subunit ribosomal protein L2